MLTYSMCRVNQLKKVNKIHRWTGQWRQHANANECCASSVRHYPKQNILKYKTKLTVWSTYWRHVVLNTIATAIDGKFEC